MRILLTLLFSLIFIVVPSFSKEPSSSKPYNAYKHRVMGSFGYDTNGGFWMWDLNPDKTFPGVHVNSFSLNYSQTTTFFNLPSYNVAMIGVITGLPKVAPGAKIEYNRNPDSKWLLPDNKMEVYAGLIKALYFYFPWTNKHVEPEIGAGFILKTSETGQNAHEQVDVIIPQFIIYTYLMKVNFNYEHYVFSVFYQHMSDGIELEIKSFNFFGFSLGYRW